MRRIPTMEKLPLRYIHKLSLRKFFYLTAFAGASQLKQSWTPILNSSVALLLNIADNSVSLKVWTSPVKSKGRPVSTPASNLTIQWHPTNLRSLWYNHMARLLWYLRNFINVWYYLYWNSEFVLEYYEEHNGVWVKKEKPAVHGPLWLPNTNTISVQLTLT